MLYEVITLGGAVVFGLFALLARFSNTSFRCHERGVSLLRNRIPLRSGRQVTVEYVLLSGVNDSPQEAEALAGLLSGARIKVNLIPVNPCEYGDFRPPSPASVDRFRNILMDAGVRTITRERRGADIRAACGQLRCASADLRPTGRSRSGRAEVSKNP